jgi:large subunit ribosomal protein L22
MSKKKAERRLAETEAMAVLRNLRTSPRKLNLVAESIRGLGASVALSQLLVNKRRVAQHVRKALQSAIANAENNHQLDVDRLYVKEASVGKGLVMRRFHPRARGRASGIVKPFSHIVIIVGERGEAA